MDVSMLQTDFGDLLCLPKASNFLFCAVYVATNQVLRPNFVPCGGKLGGK